MLGHLFSHKPGHEPNWGVRVFAVLLTAIVAAYGLKGWATSGQWLFAMLCLVIQMGANNASAQARRAKAKGRWISFWVMLGAMLGCGAFSAVSLEHAWAASAAGSPSSPFDFAAASKDPMFWFFVFLALLEPAFYWVMEDIERAPYPETPEDMADRALAEHRAAQQSQPAANAGPANGHLRIVGGTAGGAAALFGPSGQQAPEHVSLHSEAAPIVSQNTGYATAKDHVLAIVRQNPNAKHWQIAATVHKPRSTVSRWIREAQSAA